MADEAVETPNPDVEAQETDDETFDPERAKAKIAKVNSEAANLRKRLKDLEPLAKKAEELEEANKTESQRLNDKLTKAEQRAQEAELRALRLEVAQEKGLTAAQAKRLIGTSKEELEQDADEIVATFSLDNKKETTPPPRKPKEKLRPGSGDPDLPPEESDLSKLGQRIFSN